MGSEAAPQVPTKKELTHADLWQWAQFRESAIAPCFIRDIFHLQPKEEKGLKLFYLGRVPCRVVRIVGIVVGVVVYERRSLISVDDGTSVIDCVHVFQPPPSKKPQSRAKHLLESISIQEDHGKLMPKPPLIGDLITVTGRPVPWHESMQLLVDALLESYDPSLEPSHWLNVIDLHRTHYGLKEPFAIPLPPPPKTPQKPVEHAAESIIPSTVFASSPISSPAKSSPVKQTDAGSILLSHPSRLHSRSLTRNTFRIYVKYFMDQVALSNHEQSTSRSPSTTPTKRKFCGREQASTYSRRISVSPSIHNSVSQSSTSKSHGHSEISSPDAFTLSYLRRVPELSTLARRVALAEQKAKDKEIRHVAREKARAYLSASGYRHRSSKPEICIPKPETLSEKELSRRVKRLFYAAIQELHDDGAIILSFGQRRQFPLQTTSFFSETPEIWKALRSSQSISNTTSSTTMLDNIPEVAPTSTPDETEWLSEPDLDEDAFIPVTSEMITSKVIEALTEMQQASTRMRLKHMVAGENPVLNGKTRAPSPGELVSWLSREEEWSRIGEFHVLNSLRELERIGRVYQVGGGRWQGRICM